MNDDEIKDDTLIKHLWNCNWDSLKIEPRKKGECECSIDGFSSIINFEILKEAKNNE